MAKKFHGMMPNEVEKYASKLLNTDDKKIKIIYEPIVNEDGETVGVLEVEICKSCGDRYVNNIFTDGSVGLEELAEELGFR